MQKNAEKKLFFECIFCDFVCSKASNYKIHTLTPKHQNKVKGYEKMPKNAEIKNDIFCECGRKYVHMSGLWRHKKTCNNVNGNNVNGNNAISAIATSDLLSLTNIVMEVVRCNTELRQQNSDFQKHVLELCKNNNYNNNTIITNNNNKTFNLQFFLNEQCKDAMNINDFVDTFKLHFNDLEQVGKVGYVEGISDIIIKKLNAMDIYKRPIHCSDAKRDTLFVKDMNIWEKDNETNDKLRNAIKCITKKNSDMLTQWSDTHPQSRNSNSPMNNTYMSLILQAMGGKGELVDNENRIIRKISKTVLIDEGHKNVHVK